MIKASRLWTTCVLTLLFFTAVVSRLAYLQIYSHASLSRRAEKEQARRAMEDIQPRGSIIDRNGAVLAMSIRGGACYADPKMVKNPDETARMLSPLLRVPHPVLRAKLVQKKRFVWLARRLDPETADKVRELKRPGIRVEQAMKRFYPEESLGSQLLGVVGENQEGLSGVELSINSWLSGRSVPFLFKQWDLNKKASKLATRVEPEPRSVVLTIDRTLQMIAEQELAVQMKMSRPKRGTVIIQDPHSGEILAMATAPSFNPNHWGVSGLDDEHDMEDLKNPAVEAVYEPGSTFKVVTAAAVIEQGKVTPTDTFFCEYGDWQIPGRIIHDHEKDGWLTFTEVMSHSSNIGTAKAAMKIGSLEMYRYARAFGFGMPSGVGLPGDGNGILRQPSQWAASSLMTISFGQEVGVTPLQLVNAYSAIANGGLLLEPRLYKGIIDDKGQYREWATRPPVRRTISTATAKSVRKMLREVVDRGTGKAAQVVGIPVGGKTGTAQKIDPQTRQYSRERYLASFCGFAPVDNPKVVIGVFLDEPQESYWGGSEAAPLFSRILRNAVPYLRLESAPFGPLVISRTLTKS